MIGFYNRSVILTYIGFLSSIFGIMFAYEKKLNIALICLVISGICDMFDGKIARMTKRSKDAKSFGIQIDSLCDLVCFGVFPASIGIFYGINGILVIFPALFTLAGVIRLGYFNVMEIKRTEMTEEKRKYLDGLPITSTSLIFPIYILILQCLNVANYKWFLVVLYIVVGCLFVSRIKFKKPGKVMILVFVTLAIVVSVALIIKMCN